MILIKLLSPNVSVVAYNLLRDRCITCQVVPTPRDLDPSCGLSLVVEDRDMFQVRQIFQENSLEFEEKKIPTDSELIKILEG